MVATGQRPAALPVPPKRESRFVLLRFLRLLLTSVVLLYLIACVALWFGQAHLIFFPSQTITVTPKHFGMSYEDVSIPAASSRLAGWWLPSSESRQVVLYLHGNGGNLSDNAEHAVRLRRLGMSILIPDYRGYGNSSGPFPSETRVYEDAESAWRYLVEQRHFAPHDIVIYGHSLGGAIAIDLAVKHPEAAGLIVESSFASMQAMADLDAHYRVFPIGFVLTQRFDSIDKVGKLKMPALFLHGSADEVVPTRMGRQLYEAAPQPKRLVIIAGGHHMDSAAIGGDVYLSAVRDFVRSLSSSQRNAS